MGTFAGATKLNLLTASDAVGSSHGWPAMNRRTGDIAVIYSQGSAPQKIKVAIWRRIENSAAGLPQWVGPQTIVLATPQAALTPSGGALPSCSHPTMCEIDDGFACFWERRDTTIATTTMTAGGMQIEMAKLKAPEHGETEYQLFSGATEGKGYVLDNTVIAGDAGGTPRCDFRRKNQVGVVYGHQQTYVLSGGVDHTRTWAVRAAYLDFSTDGKPTLLVGGNRTGGSVSDTVDGGYAAGTIQTYLVQNIDLDDTVANPVFTVGGGLPSCCFDMRGDFAVAYEVRNNTGAYTGGIVMRIFKGPNRGDGTEANTGMNVAAIYTSTADHSASVGFAARRPMISCRNAAYEGIALTGANMSPILIAYGDQDPTGATKTKSLAKTITFPLNGASPTIASLTVPVNQNYDATAEDQSLPFTCDSHFLSCAILQEFLAGTSGDGQKFKVIYADSTGEIIIARGCERPTRPNLQAATTEDNLDIAVLCYEGQDTTGSGNEHVYAEIWKF